MTFHISVPFSKYRKKIRHIIVTQLFIKTKYRLSSRTALLQNEIGGGPGAGVKAARSGIQVSKKQNVSSLLTRKDSIYRGASLTGEK